MNPTERLNFQESKVLAAQASILASQSRMSTKGAAALASGPVGAVKGAGLVSAAAGVGAVNTQMTNQLTSIATQKATQATIDQLKVQQTAATGSRKDELATQIKSKQVELKQAQKAAYTAREASRTALPNILKILRMIQF